MARKVVDAAKESGLRIATAESCTGGLVAHLITEVAGSSAVFLGGWVVYANERKTEDLGVAARLIEDRGAVSAPVTEALAAAARDRAHADIAVATSGIAGPGSGTDAKPVGTVFIGIASTHGATAVRHNVPGLGRSATKRAFAALALQAVLDALHKDRHQSG